MTNIHVRYWFCYTCFWRTSSLNQHDKHSGKIPVLLHTLWSARGSLNQRDKHPGKIPVLLDMLLARGGKPT